MSKRKLPTLKEFMEKYDHLSAADWEISAMAKRVLEAIQRGDKFIGFSTYRPEPITLYAPMTHDELKSLKPKARKPRRIPLDKGVPDKDVTMFFDEIDDESKDK